MALTGRPQLIANIELAAAWGVVAMDPVGAAMALPAAALACAERLHKQRALVIEALAVSGEAAQGRHMGLAGQTLAAQAGTDQIAAQAEPTM